jgi:hypothetical protein
MNKEIDYIFWMMTNNSLTINRFYFDEDDNLYSTIDDDLQFHNYDESTLEPAYFDENDKIFYKRIRGHK